MDTTRFRILFDKYLQGTLDEQEQQEFNAYMPLLDEPTFSEVVDELVQLRENRTFGQEEVFQHILDRIEAGQPTASSKIRSLKATLIRIGSIAAVFLLTGLLGFMAYRLFNGGQHSNTMASISTPTLSTDIELPQENALITLADGKQMSLDEINEDIVHYKGLEIMRLADGTITMKQDQDADYFRADEKHQFAAPKGVSLRLLLPDSSVVRLNSSSSMQVYAASFGKKQRHVELSGEAFFEVAHNKDLPFIVHAKNTAVRVLGTKFNMSAYKDDKQVKTTLLSGSVQVDAEQGQLRIKPGQQAIVNSTNTIQLKENVDMNSVLAWLDGYFRFKDEPIQRIMADLTKWYPIEGVEFKGGSNDRFTGSLKRSKKLRDVLQSIEEVSDLRFDIQEGRVIVMK